MKADQKPENLPQNSTTILGTITLCVGLCIRLSARVESDTVDGGEQIQKRPGSAMSHEKDKAKPFKKQYAQIVSHIDSRLLGRAKELGYSEAEIENVPRGAVKTGLGCGNPAALAELQEGQTVLDLGSGAGLDAFVGPESQSLYHLRHRYRT